MNNNLLQVALSYATKGVSVFPCKPRDKTPATEHGFKDATTDEEQMREWWSENPDYNIGIPTGKVNGFWVLDVDGEKGRESLTKFQSDIPWNTPQVRTGRGYHLYFSCSEGVDELRGSAGKIGEGLDVRGDGNYVLAPGSVHSSGTSYEYANSHREPTEAPEKLLRSIREGSKHREGVDFSQPIPEGKRNCTLTSYAGWFLSKGMSLEAAKVALFGINEYQCKPPLPYDEVEDIVEGIYSRYEPGEIPQDDAPLYESGRREVGILMSEVKSEKVEWLWERRIPLGKLTLLEGDPDFGKSVITMDLAARVTTGRALPNGDVDNVGNLEHLENLEHVGGVVILNAEDGLSDTVKPRLLAAGADTTRIRALPPIKDDESMFSIPGDISTIEQAIKSVDAKLVIIDPLSAFMKGDVNKDQEVRKALTPLSKMAERSDAAVVVVRHFTKNVEAKALYRGGGSIGIIGAARSALAVATHPNEDELSVLVPQKGNLCKKPPALAYTIVSTDNGAPRIEWKGYVNLNADELLNVEKGEEARAKAWLSDELKNGPVSATEITETAEEAGISKSTLNRAKEKLGVESKKDGPRGSWRWHLKDSQDTQGSQDDQGGQDSHVDNVVALPL